MCPTLRASASAVQICCRQICRQLKLRRPLRLTTFKSNSLIIGVCQQSEPSIMRALNLSSSPSVIPLSPVNDDRLRFVGILYISDLIPGKRETTSLNISVINIRQDSLQFAATLTVWLIRLRCCILRLPIGIGLFIITALSTTLNQL